MKTLQSIAAVLAGLLVPVILAFITDAILENTGVFPTQAYQKEFGFTVLWMNLLALAYRFLYTIVGGWLTAKIAPSKPMRHVIILGSIGTAVALLANLAVAHNPATANVLPVWFMVVLVLMAFPGAWLGGKLYAAHSTKK